jgi:hypothetical protein
VQWIGQNSHCEVALEEALDLDQLIIDPEQVDLELDLIRIYYACVYPCVEFFTGSSIYSLLEHDAFLLLKTSTTYYFLYHHSR